VDTVLDLAKVLIPAAATLVGLYFANAFKRRTRQEVLERRVDAYVAFWPVMNIAASTRLDGPWAGGPLTSDERRAIFEESSAHIRIGLDYLPAVARRLHHCRDLAENPPFDFLTWFEFTPADAVAFDELLHRLRETPEWRYVEREVELRLRKAPHVDSN